MVFVLESFGSYRATDVLRRQPAFSWKFSWRSSLPRSAAPRMQVAVGNASTTSSLTAQVFPAGGVLQVCAAYPIALPLCSPARLMHALRSYQMQLF